MRQALLSANVEGTKLLKLDFYLNLTHYYYYLKVDMNDIYRMIDFFRIRSHYGQMGISRCNFEARKTDKIMSWG